MLAGKTIVIISGSSGIGLEIARWAVARQASVTITGRSADRLESAVRSIGGHVTTASFDATDRSAVSDFFGSLERVDHLVSCFGDTQPGGFLDLDEKRAREVIENKFWAQLHIVRAGHSKVAPDGSIVLTAGPALDRGTVPYGSAFSVTGNTMVEVLVKGLAAEIAPVRINVVQPGVTRTALFDDMPEQEREAMFGTFAARLPVNRIPEPHEVALSYIHLMENPVITGDRIRPDGGPRLTV